MARTNLFQTKNLVPALLGLGIVGVLVFSKKKEETGRTEPKENPLPIPVNTPGTDESKFPQFPGKPSPLPPSPIQPGQIPPIPTPGAPSQTPGGFSRNPLYYAPGVQPAIKPNPLGVITYPERDPTGNCRGNEVFLPITDPRINLFPEYPRILTRNGTGICVPIERLGGMND
jgi:hypothetical protein